MSAVEIRRLTAADLSALAIEVDRARQAGEFRASSDPEAAFFLKVSAHDPSIVGGAFEGDELVGFISGEFKLVIVRPDRRRRGIGRLLVELSAEIERGRGREVLILGRLPDDEAVLPFLEATGFGLHSILWDLDLPRDAAVAEPVWPAGVIARPFDRSRDVDPWIALFNGAFADHATPLQVDRSFVIDGLDDPAIDDRDTELVEEVASGELIGFCAAGPHREHGSIGPTGEIWTIGVRPDRQGRGLGRQLLRWGVGYLRSIGATDVELSVNGRNDRALGLYEDEGFVRRQTRERWARALDADDPE